MPTIRLENAQKVYKGDGRSAAAVLDINLTIRQGEFVFLVGTRGAGKSTLIGLINGEIESDRGRVLLDEVDLKNHSKQQAKKIENWVSTVAQESTLVRKATVRQNLAPPPAKNTMRAVTAWQKEEHLMKKALGLVGMAGCEDRYPQEFTISETRRIELAKAIMHSPKILILDEITDRMDEDTIWDILHLLEELNKRGTTILMATNAKQFINIMRKRVVTMSDGKIVGDVPRGRYGQLRQPRLMGLMANQAAQPDNKLR